MQRPFDDYISPGLVIGLLMNKIKNEKHTRYQYSNVRLLRFWSLFSFKLKTNERNLKKQMTLKKINNPTPFPYYRVKPALNPRLKNETDHAVLYEASKHFTTRSSTVVTITAVIR